ncbi:helix-turn-helix domain-containing protein [Ruminococcus albus]|uniref:helix-turn-helix domain-containing protein n=1 Tax=Ruminococcus albus TaxID=1264 RepID=UPI00068625A4|nr:helix-turn-helix domain-containing protein [Ruminococcus albus]
MPNNRLKQLREERKLSQKDVANKLNIPPTTYSGYENNKREPNSEMLINLADFFNCSIDYLIGRSNERINDSVLDKVFEFDNDLLEDSVNIYDARRTQIYRDSNMNIKDIFSETVSNREIEHITKYRTLDGYGKKAVDSVLDVEYERCRSKSEQPMIEVTLFTLPVSAGTGEFLSEEMSKIITIPDTPLNRSADFIVEVSGDSMLPEYKNEDYLLVHKQETVEVDEIGIFVVNGCGYVKKFGGDRLISLNEKYDDITFGEFDTVVCYGKVIGKVL